MEDRADRGDEPGLERALRRNGVVSGLRYRVRRDHYGMGPRVKPEDDGGGDGL